MPDRREHEYAEARVAELEQYEERVRERERDRVLREVGPSDDDTDPTGFCPGALI